MGIGWFRGRGDGRPNDLEDLAAAVADGNRGGSLYDTATALVRPVLDGADPGQGAARAVGHAPAHVAATRRRATKLAPFLAHSRRVAADHRRGMDRSQSTRLAPRCLLRRRAATATRCADAADTP